MNATTAFMERVRVSRVYHLIDEGLLEEALDEAQQALREHPRESLCYVDLAYVMMAMGVYDEAIEQLEEARDIAPEGTADLNILIATCLYKLKRTEEVIDLLNDNRRVRDGDIVAIMLLARAYAAQGQYANARDLLHEAYQANQSNHELMALLADLNYESGEYRQALLMLQPALSTSPNITAYHLLECRILRKLERPKAALGAALRALELAPQKPSVHALLAGIYADLGDASSSARHRRASFVLKMTDSRRPH